MIAAIDGPAGAGKSTIAKLAAQKLGWQYLDSGAFYRCYTLHALNQGMDYSRPQTTEKLLATVELNADYSGSTAQYYLNGENVTEAIRSFAVTAAVSAASACPSIRQAVNHKLRETAATGAFFIDGRDIGTAVFPEAQFKFFLTASVEVRAKRRFEELQMKGQKPNLEQLTEDIRARDMKDSTRSTDPLQCASDAIIIDSSEMNIDQVTDVIFKNMDKALQRG